MNYNFILTRYVNSYVYLEEPVFVSVWLGSHVLTHLLKNHVTHAQRSQGGFYSYINFQRP